MTNIETTDITEQVHDHGLESAQRVGLSRKIGRVLLKGRGVPLVLTTAGLTGVSLLIAANLTAASPNAPSTPTLAPTVSSQASTPSTRTPDVIPTSPSTSPSAAEKAQPIVIPALVPVKAVFNMQQGTRTVNIDPSAVQTTPPDANNIVYKLIDPPLKYCPGVYPTNVSVPHTTASTQAECEALYYITDYGLPSYGVPSTQLKPKPGEKQAVVPFVVGHSSVKGYDLSGNFIGGMKINDTATLYDKQNDSITYKVVAETKPEKGTIDVGATIAETDPTHWLLGTCDQHGNANDIFELVQVSAVVQPPPTAPLNPNAGRRGDFDLAGGPY